MRCHQDPANHQTSTSPCKVRDSQSFLPAQECIAPQPMKSPKQMLPSGHSVCQIPELYPMKASCKAASTVQLAKPASLLYLQDRRIIAQLLTALVANEHGLSVARHDRKKPRKRSTP